MSKPHQLVSLGKVAQREAADPTGRHCEFTSQCLLRHGRELSPLSTLGDSINAILSAAAMNFGKLMGFYWPILFQILESLLPKLSNDRKILCGVKRRFPGPTGYLLLANWSAPGGDGCAVNRLFIWEENEIAPYCT